MNVALKKGGTKKVYKEVEEPTFLVTLEMSIEQAADLLLLAGRVAGPPVDTSRETISVLYSGLSTALGQANVDHHTVWGYDRLRGLSIAAKS